MIEQHSEEVVLSQTLSTDVFDENSASVRVLSGPIKLSLFSQILGDNKYLLVLERLR